MGASFNILGLVKNPKRKTRESKNEMGFFIISGGRHSCFAVMTAVAGISAFIGITAVSASTAVAGHCL